MAVVLRRAAAHRGIEVQPSCSTAAFSTVRLVEQFGITTGFGLQTLVRNQEFRPESTLGGRSKVRMGAPHPIFDLGVEVAPLPWVSFSPVLSWIAPPTPLRYGPSFSLVLRFHVPQEREPQP